MNCDGSELDDGTGLTMRWRRCECREARFGPIV